MTDNKHTVTLSLTKNELQHLQWGLNTRIEDMAKNDDGVDMIDAELYAMLQPHVERISLAEEQEDIDKRMKELEQRKNELRA